MTLMPSFGYINGGLVYHLVIKPPNIPMFLFVLLGNGNILGCEFLLQLQYLRLFTPIITPS